MPYFQPRTPEWFGELAKELTELPGASWILPDAYDPGAYIHPVVGITHKAFMKAAYELGVKGMEKEARRKFARGVFSLPEKYIKDIKAFLELPKHYGAGGVAGLYRPESKTILSKAIPKGASITTPFHEVAHHMWTFVVPEDRIKLRTVFEQMWPKNKSKALASRLGTKFDNPQEAFAEAFAAYLYKSDEFFKFPPGIRDVVKKYLPLVQGVTQGR